MRCVSSSPQGPDLDQHGVHQSTRQCYLCCLCVYLVLQDLADQYIIRKPGTLTWDRLQPGQNPATAGDPPVQPWAESPTAAPAEAAAATASATTAAAEVPDAVPVVLDAAMEGGAVGP